MKFRLIKWYPSLPKDWEEGHEIIKMKGEPPYVSCDEMKPGALYSKEVENNPEFWEKVEEKDYEILKVMYTSKYPYYNIGAHPSIIIPLPVIYDKKPDWFKTHSVKRLSDGEVFTVGDKITGATYNKPREILSFKLYNKLGLGLQQKYGVTNLKDARHTKDPLFTTEDGVDIYEGDEYYHVSDSLKMYQVTACVNDLKPPINRAFPTKEKAEEYIEQHKPRYSKADVKEAFKEIQRLPRNQGVLLYEWIGDIKYQIYEQLEKSDL